MDFSDVSGGPWSEGEIPGEHDWYPAQLAFAAYEDAWKERVRTGITSSTLLVSALQARKVPASEYADGTRLHKALFTAWDKGRPSTKLKWVITRYQLGSVKEIFTLLKDETPDWMRIPAPYKKLENWPQDEDDESTSVDFTPDSGIDAWLPRWFDGIADGYEQEDRERWITVWLRLRAEPGRADVMVGEQAAGIAELPLWAYETLSSPKIVNKNRVAHGELFLKKSKDGSLRTKGVQIELPEVDDHAT